jgi:hypothetical protein
MDGVDMSSFMRGQSESSGRDNFLFMGTDGQIVSAKWKTVKVHFRLAESDSWTAALVKPQSRCWQDRSNYWPYGLGADAREFAGGLVNRPLDCAAESDETDAFGDRLCLEISGS